MSDTPETDSEADNGALCDQCVPAEFARKLERERDEWKAAHDNQAKLKRIISDRPDLKERAKLVEELIKERDEARSDLAYRLEQYAIKQLQLSDARKTILELQKK
jgi:hypothetical protein